jgi:hypothetical protein
MGMIRIAAIVSVVLLAGQADARYTKGDAEAVLRAGPTGGGAIRSHGGSHGAPQEFGLAIRPFFEPGRHYCVSDWHSIMIAWVDLVFEKPTDPVCHSCLVAEWGGEPPFTAEDSREAFASLENTMTLDGEPLDLVSTPVKPFLNQLFIDDNVGFLEEVCGCDYSVTDAFYVHFGKVVGPADLGVGEHAIENTVTFSDGFTETFGTTFYVDGPESDTCAE